MKKAMALVCLLLTLLTASSCGDTRESSPAAADIAVTETPAPPAVQVIPEKYFTQQINHIYYNPKGFIGTQISYEGIFGYFTTEPDKKEAAFVFRYGPGCCANDANVGFEILWDQELPEENDWVRVTGEIDYILHGGIQYLGLYVTELEVLDQRGAETVN